MAIFNWKVKLALVFLAISLVALVFSVYAALAAQQVKVSGGVSVTFFAPKTLSNIKDSLSGIETLTFDYYSNQSSNITGFSSYALDGKGCDDGGISLYKSGTTAYVLSKAEIYAPVDCTSYFQGLTSIKSITFNNFNTSNVTNMSSMFSGCTKLATINGLTKFKTTNVTTMSKMFYGCSSISSLDFGYINSTSVTNMSDMFNGCSSLASLAVYSLDTNNVTNMSSMFYGCSSLPSLDITNFNTGKVTTMVNMFAGLSNAGITSFGRNSNYKIKVGNNFTFNNVDSISGMFKNCSKLTTVDITTGMYYPKLTDVSFLFEGCSGLTNVDLSGMTTNGTYSTGSGYVTNITNAKGMFRDCVKLIKVNMFNASKVTNTSQMLYRCTSLTDASFYTASSSITFDFECYGFSVVTDASRMFENCTSLTTAGLGFTTENANISRAFAGCASLKSAGVCSGGNMTGVFSGCEKLTDVGVTSSSYTTSISDLFYGCVSLKYLDLSDWDTSNVTDMSGLFNGCNSLGYVDLSSFNTSKVTDMSYIFSGCSSLQEIDIYSFDTTASTNITQMFSGCSEVKHIIVGDQWNRGYGSYVFLGCLNLSDGYNFKYNASKTDWRYATTDGNGYLTSKTYLNANELQLFFSDYGVDEYDSGFYFGYMDEYGSADLNGECWLFENVKKGDSQGYERGGSTAFWSDTYDSYMLLSKNKIQLVYEHGYEGTEDWREYMEINTLFNDNLRYCKTIKITNLDTRHITSMSEMFWGCMATEIDLSGLDVSNVTSFSMMFHGCANLTEVDLSSFGYWSNNINCSFMFASCDSLSTIYVKADTYWCDNINNGDAMFQSCPSLPGVPNISYNYNWVSYAMLGAAFTEKP